MPNIQDGAVNIKLCQVFSGVKSVNVVVIGTLEVLLVHTALYKLSFIIIIIII